MKSLFLGLGLLSLAESLNVPNPLRRDASDETSWDVPSMPMVDAATIKRPSISNLMGMIEPAAEGMIGSIMENAIVKKPVDTQQLPPQLAPTNKRTKVRYGPYVLGANATVQPMGVIQSPCTDCMVLQGGASLEHENGTIANVTQGNVYTHHIMTADSGKLGRDMVCPDQSTPAMPLGPTLFLGGASDDATTVRQVYAAKDGTPKTGFYIAKGQNLIMFAMLLNYAPVAQPVYIAFDAEYIPGHPEGYLDSLTVPISSANCDGTSEFMVPKNVDKYTKKSGDFIVPGDGYIVNMQGHLHDGGVGVDFFLNDKQICHSTSVYGPGASMGGGMRKRGANAAGQETIVAMTSCDDPIAIKTNDKININANFDLEAHPMRESQDGQPVEVMGLGDFVFAIPYGAKYKDISA